MVSTINSSSISTTTLDGSLSIDGTTVISKTTKNIDIDSISGPSGFIIKASAIVHNTRTDISGNAGDRSFNWGTFTKTRTDTNILFNGTLMVHDAAGNDSDATGLYVGFSSSSLSDLKKRSLSRIDVTGTNFNERFLQTTGYASASELPYAETYTVRWGVDGSGSNYLANFWNPNTTDDSRYMAQRESTLLIYEVMP